MTTKQNHTALLWSMADLNGRCPGRDGPCMHFLPIPVPQGSDDGLQEVTRAYNSFVEAANKAASAHSANGRPPEGSGQWHVSLVVSNRGAEFRYTYDAEPNAHRPVRGTLEQYWVEVEGRPGPRRSPGVPVVDPGHTQ